MNKWGIKAENVDREIKPVDDLFRFVNGKWLKDCVIPADKSAWGSFYELNELVEDQIKVIVEELSVMKDSELNHEQRLVKYLYQAYNNTEAVEKEGLGFVTSLIAKIDGIDSYYDYARVLSEIEFYNGGGLFSNYVSFDAGDSSRMLLHFGQGGITLPERDYYLKDEHAGVRTKYLEHIKKMYSFYGIESKAEDILDFETKVAKLHWDQVKGRDESLTYNLLSYGEFKKYFNELNLDIYFMSAEVKVEDSDEIVVSEPSFFVEFNQMLKESDLAILKNWLTWSLISGTASYLTKELVDENFRFWGKELDGVEEQEPRWKYALNFVENKVGEVVGKEYVKRHYPEKAALKMDELIKHLIAAYKESFENLTWLSEETKKLALVKLSKFNPKVGSPKVWEDYSNLDLRADESLITYAYKVNKFEFAKDFRELKEPVNRDKWYITPQTVNAYYLASLNEIVFPAAILQAPFFDVDADDAVNYGAIGAIIGHEIGHGFDDQGSKYDGDGNLVSWWSASDRANFEILTQNLIKQYDDLKFEELPEVKVNGAYTIGENIGDLSGLSIAYKAYLKSQEGCEDIVMDGFTREQRFFLGWAQAWRNKVRPEALVNDVATDPHAPAEFRCNQIVRNLDAFYKAFNVGQEDLLYLEPAHRVTIW